MFLLNTTMPFERDPEEAMRQLHFDADMYLKGAVEEGTNVVIPDFAQDLAHEAAITPGGLEIVRVEDELQLSADLKEVIKGRNRRITLRVDFDSLGGLPLVQKDLYFQRRPGAMEQRNVRTLPVSHFPYVASRLGELIHPVEKVATKPKF